MWRSCFVFMQTTAYEVRISDWSSDVCSSDLAQGDVSDVIVKMANTHNTYLEIWVFQGVIGVVLLIALLVTALTYFIRRLRSQDPGVQVAAVCGASLIVAYSVFSLSHVIDRKSVV